VIKKQNESTLAA